MLFLCLGLATQARAQANAGLPPDCSRIDKAKAPLFITFEGVESKHTLLSLHNNSRCPVLIPTNQLALSMRMAKQANGTLRLETLEYLKDGSRVPVVYNLSNLRGSKDTVVVTDGCVVMLWQLLPRQSIIFTVPLEEFRKHADVGVEFRYLWEEDGGNAIGGEFGHYVFFRNEYLPQDEVR